MRFFHSSFLFSDEGFVIDGLLVLKTRVRLPSVFRTKKMGSFPAYKGIDHLNFDSETGHEQDVGVMRD